MAEKSVAAVLNAAVELVERGWCQGTFAKNMAGRDESWSASNACAWCAEGAIMRATDDMNADVFLDARGHMVRALGAYSIARWNDAPGRTQAEVVAKLREAAALAAAEGK